LSRYWCFNWCLTLYVVIKAMVEGDTSSLGVAATGAVAGAGVSAAIGGG
jgi:hypothetical protein